MKDPTTQSFKLHKRKTSRFGKLLGVVGVLGATGLAGAVAWFWHDTLGQLAHLRARDRLAIPAAFVLAQRGAPPEARELLLAALTDAAAEPMLRRQCAAALGTLRTRDVIDALGTASERDADMSVRAAALDALAATGDATGADAYVHDAFDQESPLVLAAASRAVATLQLRRHIPRLIQLLAHHNRAVNAPALRALETFKTDGVSYELDRTAWTRWYDEGR